MRNATALLLALFTAAASLSAQTVSTKCVTQEVQVENFPKERRLIACDSSFAENLLWHLDRADSVSGELDGLFHRRLTGRGAVIYVIDTGVSRAHTEFQRETGSTVIAGLDTSTPLPGACSNRVVEPCHPVQIHGTSTASIAGGRNVGLAPDAKIVAVTGLSGNRQQWNEALTAILKHAFDPSAPPFRTAIINISGGMDLKESEYAEFDEQIRRLTTGIDVNGNADPNGKRFLIVAAALNGAVPKGDGTSTPSLCAADGAPRYRPGSIGAQIDGVVTVGGITSANRLWEGSCKGPLVEVVAPAENIFIASLGGIDHYRLEPLYFNHGTSYAAPYVSGIAAQFLEIDPNRTPAELEALLKASPSRVEGVPVPVIPAFPYPKRRSVR